MSAFIEEGLVELKICRSSRTFAARKAAWSGASRRPTSRPKRRRMGQRFHTGVLSGDAGGDGIHLLGPLARRCSHRRRW